MMVQISESAIAPFFPNQIFSSVCEHVQCILSVEFSLLELFANVFHVCVSVSFMCCVLKHKQNPCASVKLSFLKLYILHM